MQQEMTDSELFALSDKYFPTPLQQFQAFDKYVRFNYEKGRRETWIETVDRVVNFLRELSHSKLDEATYDRIRRYILEMKAMPSMRLLAMAGPAARRNNISIYNCCFVGVDSIDAFVEALIISMSGCGVGFSVESEYVSQIPVIEPQKLSQDGSEPLQVHTVADSSEGWAEALRLGLEAWASGGDVQFDLSLIRPAGAVLRTKGGRASGPKPLEDMLTFCRETMLGAQGRQLTPLEAHDMMCEIGNAAVSGGTRRTAMISLFDADNQDMLYSKHGDTPSRRWNANNSIVIEERLSRDEIAELMRVMHESKRGEPGLFSRYAANLTKPARRSSARFGTNPCAEVTMRSQQFCNLSIAVARSDDTFDSLRDKVEVAAIIGTIQSAGTNFNGLRPGWKENCDEERLLGVDITGQMDCPVVQDSIIMAKLKNHAIETNKYIAHILGINPSAAVTCNKPAGNSSTLLNCANGIHARHSAYYIRHVRVSAHGALYKVLKASGVPLVPDNGMTEEDATRYVAAFPVASPKNAITKDQQTAMQQLEYWKLNKIHWCEHSPSCTITYHEHELPEMIDWLYTNQDILTGLSFLPASDPDYDLLPYQTITKEEYEAAAAAFPEIQWYKIAEFENSDMTTSTSELACSSALGCEVHF